MGKRRLVNFAEPVLAALLTAGCVAQSRPLPIASAPQTPSAIPSIGRAATNLPTFAPAAQPTAQASPVDLGCAAIVASKPPQYPDATLPPLPTPSLSTSNSASAAALEAALTKLTALRSYRMSVDLVGLNPVELRPDTTDLAIRGTVTHIDGFAMDAIMGTRMREPDGSAAISSGGFQVLIGGGYLWTTDNVSQVLEPTPTTLGLSALEFLVPERLASRVIAPFAAGYRRVGIESHGGATTVHYRASKLGADAYAAMLGMPGSAVTADLWIAVDGGALVGARIAGKASHTDANSGRTVDDSVLLAIEITDSNSAANIVRLPAKPVADPVRPTVPPVDLRLEYQVMPANGVSPTGADLDEIDVALRYRLDVSNRPVKVDTVGPDRIVVTVCGTKHPDADRRLIVAAGALTVVPLPVSAYGTTAHPGSMAPPTVGSSIDPALTPIAPAAGLGLTRAHVDPATGQRGLAFVLGNQAEDKFRAYATAHPHEYVAVVLDGKVMATLPIEGPTAEGRFVFTGDYTDAESHLLASYLYRDPIRFELRPTSDTAIPAS